MTVCFPPLIKPDGRFSRIRLSEFLAPRPKPRRPHGFATPERFWALVALAGRHHVLRCASCGGTSGVPSLPREFSEPEVRHGIITTTNASDFCHGPCGLPLAGGCAAGGVLHTRHDRSPRLPERHFATCRPRRPRRSPARPTTVIPGR